MLIVGSDFRRRLLLPGFIAALAASSVPIPAAGYDFQSIDWFSEGKLTAIATAGRDTVYVAGGVDSGFVHRSLDGGRTWSTSYIKDDKWLFGLAASGPVVYAGGYPSG